MPDDQPNETIERVQREYIARERAELVETLRRLIWDIEHAGSLRLLDIRMKRSGRRVLRVRLPTIGADGV